MLPCTTKRRTTTNLKTKNNRNCQKIELYGSLTTKELKNYSSRLVGGAEMGSWGGEDLQQGSTGGLGEEVAHRAGSHVYVWINWEQDRLHNPGFQCSEIKPQNL